MAVMREESAKSVDRKPVAAGRFYPSSPEILRADLKNLFSRVSDQKEYPDIRAIISPHAGYVFSGLVAASAFASVPSDQKFSNIFIIGSSHIAAFEGASVYGEGDFITPLGRVLVNREIAAALRTESEFFRHGPDVHTKEHSIEVQLPFLQYRYSEPPPIVPILIGTDDLAVIRSLTATLKPWFTRDNLFIISSDFSHYPSYDDATATDRITAEAIMSGNPDELTDTLRKFRSSDIKGLSTNMCGWTAGLTLLYLTAGEKSLRYHHLLYRNSGDSQYGDRDGVVGYHSFAVADDSSETEEDHLKGRSAVQADGQNMDQVEDQIFVFTDKEKRTLFEIARASISSGLTGGGGGGGGYRSWSAENMSAIRKPGGVFVTLYLKGELRGCIGRIVSSAPICDNVAEMAFAAAFSDPRFTGLTRDEYSLIEIEISVLSPLKRIFDIEEIIIGKHGLFIKREGRSGVLLPQVASERGWTAEQFLQHTARDKAGIGQDGWRDAEISVFETLILKENPPLGTVINKQ
jgi:MEMO1 family protein